MESQAIFQSYTQATIFLLNCLPGLDEGEEEELEGVELADDRAEADEDGGGGQPTLQDAE